MERPRILICGGRDFTDYSLLKSTMSRLGYGFPHNTVVVIEGGAKGADRLARDWAINNHCQYEIYEADWKSHGKRAGPIRNQRMLDEGKPDLVVAFPTETSRGTWDMVRRSQKNKIETIVIGPIAKNPI